MNDPTHASAPRTMPAPPTEPMHAFGQPIRVPTGEYVPLPVRERLVQVDFLRGVALLGILIVNMAFFFEPFGRMVDPTWLHWEPTVGRAAWATVSAIFTFKFISLFSMMFGFGVAMQLQRVDDSGRRAWPFAFRRFGLLALIGLVHGTFIWYGDILFVYACLGLALTAMRKLSPKVLLIVATCIAGVLALFALGGFAVTAITEAVGDDPVEPLQFVASTETPEFLGFSAMKEASFYPAAPEWMHAEVHAYREGPFSDALVFRATSYAMALAVAVFSYGWHSLLMMLLGMWAFKSGFWKPDRAAFRKWVAVVGLGVGMPLSLAGVAFVWMTDFSSGTAWGGYQALLSLSAMIMPAGYAVLIGGAALALPQAIVRAVASAGRMALTVYLLESIAATSVAYWWGFGKFGSLTGWQTLGLAVAIWVGLVLMATLWLRVFKMGPIEWVWRACTYETAHPARAAHATLPAPTSRSDQPAA
jgi:uncharacterized protein